MFPSPGVRIGKVMWRVILEGSVSSHRRTVVVSAATKRGASMKARRLWKISEEGCHIYDTSPVSGFDPSWFDVPWSHD